MRLSPPQGGPRRPPSRLWAGRPKGEGPAEMERPWGRAPHSGAGRGRRHFGRGARTYHLRRRQPGGAAPPPPHCLCLPSLARPARSYWSAQRHAQRLLGVAAVSQRGAEESGIRLKQEMPLGRRRRNPDVAPAAWHAGSGSPCGAAARRVSPQFSLMKAPLITCYQGSNSLAALATHVQCHQRNPKPCLWACSGLSVHSRVIC